MDVDIDQPRHDEMPGMVEHLLSGGGLGRLRRRTDKLQDATRVEHQGLRGSGILVDGAEQGAATHMCLHGCPLELESTLVMPAAFG